ncbi:MAG: hypothetical protein HC927_08765 [Deltaproteobacteria bacterium]|nr:hypothetical protein [Deltaproteobacteria bacterium]
MMAHYMPWYETPQFRGAWGIHWAGPNGEFDPGTIGANGRPEIFSNYFPLIGLYDSVDPAVVECQLLQMKLAGIDGVIADWYGLSDAADYAEIHEATELLFARAGELGMSFAACFEDRSIQFRVQSGQLAPSGVQADLTGTFQWMQANWFNAPHYLKRQGRPVLLQFGPIFLTNGAVWEQALSGLAVRPWLAALHNLWTLVPADAAFMWVHWETWNGYPPVPIVKQRWIDRIGQVSGDATRVIPSAVAGFDDVYTDQIFPFLDHRGGQTFREALQVAMDGPWEMVQLVTWNDYGEGTMMEPTVEFGYTFLEIVQEERRRELGASFAFTAADLRLPARLLELRRGGGANGGVLDQIAAWLALGDVASARAAMDRDRGCACCGERRRA